MKNRSSPGVLWVKDPALSLKWLRFDPWQGNLGMPPMQTKRKKKKKGMKNISDQNCNDTTFVKSYHVHDLHLVV